MPDGSYKFQYIINPQTSDQVDCAVTTSEGIIVPIDSKFYAGQAADFNSDVAVTGALNVKGNASVSGSLHVIGDIDVQGNINSVTRTETTLEVEDKLIIVASGSNAAATNDGGLQFGGHKGSGQIASILFDNANTAIDFNIGTTTEIRLEDGKLLPETTNDVDLGSSTLQYKDLYIDGKAYIDQLGEHLDANSKNITGAGNLFGSAVSGSATVSGGAGSFVTVSGSSTLKAGGAMTIAGASTLNSGLTVNGAESTFNDNVSICSGGNLTVADVITGNNV